MPTIPMTGNRTDATDRTDGSYAAYGSYAPGDSLSRASFLRGPGDQFAGAGKLVDGVTVPRPTLAEVIEKANVENSAAFGSRLRTMAQFNPDEVAQKYGMKRRTGAPIGELAPDKAAPERVALAQSVSREQIDEWRANRPAFFRRVMEDAPFAAMVADEVEHVAEAEGLWPSIKAMGWDLTMGSAAYSRDIGKAYTRGQVQHSQAYLGNQLLQRALETGQYDEGILTTLRSLDEEMQGLESSRDRGLIGGIPEAIAEQTTNLVGGITARALGVIGGPVGVGAAGFAHGAATESGHAMAEFSRMTDDTGEAVDPRMAAGFALAAGAVNGAMEIVGGGTLLRALPGNSGLKKKLSAGAVRVGLGKILQNRAKAQAFWKVIEPHATAVMVEPTTEALQRLVTIVAGELAKESSFDEYDMQVLNADTLGQMAAEAEAGLQVALGLGVAGTAQRAARPPLAADAAQSPAAKESGNQTGKINEVDGGQAAGGAGVAPETMEENRQVTDDDLGDAGRVLMQEVEEVQAAEREGLFLDRLGEWAKKGLLTQRSPEATAEFIDDVARRAVGEGIETVRVDGVAVRDAIEGKPDIAQELRRALPDFDRQMAQAEQVGGDILIPLGAYAAYIAPGKSGQALEGQFKLRPGGMTAVELNEQGPEIQARMRALVERQADAAVREAEARSVADEIVQERMAELTAVGEAVGSAQVKTQAESAAVIEVSLLERLGRLMGMGVREARDRFRARVRPGRAEQEGTEGTELEQVVEDGESGGKMGGSEGPSMTWLEEEIRRMDREEPDLIEYRKLVKGEQFDEAGFRREREQARAALREEWDAQTSWFAAARESAKKRKDKDERIAFLDKMERVAQNDKTIFLRDKDGDPLFDQYDEEDWYYSDAKTRELALLDHTEKVEAVDPKLPQVDIERWLQNKREDVRTRPARDRARKEKAIETGRRVLDEQRIQPKDNLKEFQIYNNAGLSGEPLSKGNADRIKKGLARLKRDLESVDQVDTDALALLDRVESESKSDPTIFGVQSHGQPFIDSFVIDDWIELSREERQEVIDNDSEEQAEEIDQKKIEARESIASSLHRSALYETVQAARIDAHRAIRDADDLELAGDLDTGVSQYAFLKRKGDDDRNTIKVRISDHEEKTDHRGDPRGGFYIDNFGAESFHDAADISIVIGVGDAIDAEKFIALVRKRLAEKHGENPPVAPSDGGGVSDGAWVLTQLVDRPSDVGEANRIIGEMPAEALARYLDSFQGGRLGTLARTWLEARTGKRDIEEVGEGEGIAGEDARATNARATNATGAMQGQESLFGVGNEAGYNLLDDAAPGQTGMLFQEADQPERTIAGVYGDATEVKVEGVAPYQARYKVVEVTDLVPSHDFTTGSGRPNEAFPKSLQPRNLNDNLSQVGRILEMGRAWQPGDANSTSEFAQTGPPTVSPEGYVINGNGRVGAAQLAASEGGLEKNKEFLLRAASLFGVDPVAIANMANPILVREMEFSGKSVEAMRFAAQGNVSITGSESPVREAHRLNRTIGADLLRLIDPEAGTIREAVSDEGSNREMVALLQNNLPPAERAKYIEQGKLNEIGVQLLEDMLLTQFVPVEIVERLRAPGNRKGLLNTIESAIPVLQRIVQQTHETPGSTPTDLRPALLGALDFLSRNPEAKSYEAAANLDLFSGATPQEIEMVADALLKVGDQPRVFRELLAAFGTDLEAGLGLDPKQAADAFAERFQVAKREGAAFAAQEGAFTSHFDAALPDEVAMQTGVDTQITPEMAEAQRELTKTRRREIRGSIDIEGREIRLTPKANFSTFVHELGHWYLIKLDEVLRTAGEDAPGLGEAQRDLDVILEWVGATDVASMSEAQHEQFANGFLKYLQEGKVPEGAGAQVTKALRNFRNWLVGLWRSGRLQAIEGIEIADDVRAVFDRMVAGDAAVDEARHQAGARALSPNRNEFDFTDAEFAEYQNVVGKVDEIAKAKHARRAVRAMNKRNTPEWKQRLTDLTAEIKTELESSRARRARRFLQTGILGEGAAPVEVHRLDAGQTRAALTRMKDGAKLVKQLKFGQKGLVTPQEGLHPQAVAELFGFPSAEAMLREVIPATDQAVEQMAKRDARARLMAAESPAGTETRSKQATDDLLNPWAEKMAILEIMGGDRMAGRRGISPAAIQAHATEALRDVTLGSIRPDEHVREMKRQHNLAMKALQKGDYRGMADARRAWLARYYLYKAAREAEREVTKRMKQMARYERASLREQLGNIYTDQIDAVKGHFHLSEKRLPGGIERLDVFLTKEAQKGRPVDELLPVNRESAPSWILAEMAGEGRHYRTLTLEQFREVHQAIQLIETLGQWERESRLFDERINIEAMTQEFMESVPKYNKRRARDESGKREGMEKVRRHFRNLVASMTRIEALALRMDGGNPNGPVSRFVVNVAQKGLARFRAMEEAAVKEILRVLGGYTKADWNRMIDGMTFEKWFMVAMNQGNPGNWARVLETARAGRIPGIEIVAGEDDAVLSLRLEKKIDEVLEKRDRDAVQALWDLNDKVRPALEELQRRTTGSVPRWIEAVPIETRHGTYRGGYFRIMYDPATSNKVEQREADMLNPEEMQKIGWTSPLKTRDGMTRERKGSGGATLKLELSAIGQSMQEVLFRIAMQDVAMHLGRVFRDKNLGQLFKDHLTDGEWTELQDWTRRVLRIREGRPHSIEPFVRHIGMGVSVGGLGFNAMTTLMQPLGYFHSVQQLGPKYALRGMQRWLESLAKGTILQDMEDIYQRDEYMRDRANNRNVLLYDLRDSLTTDKRKRDKWNSTMFLTIQKAQSFVDLMTWWGAYEKAADANPKLSDDELTAMAVKAVRVTQGGGGIADASSIETHNALVKAMSPFMSYYNVKWNLLKNSWAQFEREIKGEHPGRAFAKFASDLLLLTFIEQQISGMIRSALDSGDDEDGWVEWLIKNQFNGMFAMIPIVRDLPSIIEYGSSGGGAIGRAQQDLARAWQQGVRLGGKIWAGEAFDENSYEDDWLKPLKAGVKAGNFLSPIYYPSGQINRFLQGMADFDERQDQRGTAAAVGGLFFNMGKPDSAKAAGVVE